ncbi:hypothetical protein LINGRAHAP2_LOCUS35202 [Linum grandiflorum]
MTSPDMQRDIIDAIATEATKAIINNIEGDLFIILADEASDVSIKEHMDIVLRYVNQVKDTKVLTFKKEDLEYMLVTYGLSLSKLREYGYDEVSNIKGQIYGLKILILAENPSAYYVYCLLINFS